MLPLSLHTLKILFTHYTLPHVFQVVKLPVLLRMKAIPPHPLHTNASYYELLYWKVPMALTRCIINNKSGFRTMLWTHGSYLRTRHQYYVVSMTSVFVFKTWWSAKARCLVTTHDCCLLLNKHRPASQTNSSSVRRIIADLLQITCERTLWIASKPSATFQWPLITALIN